MSVMTVRLDETTEAALAYLHTATQKTKSQIIRDALLQAEQEARREKMRAQAEAVASDPHDVSEARAVLAFMGGGDAW